MALIINSKEPISTSTSVNSTTKMSNTDFVDIINKMASSKTYYDFGLNGQGDLTTDTDASLGQFHKSGLWTFKWSFNSTGMIKAALYGWDKISEDYGGAIYLGNENKYTGYKSIWTYTAATMFGYCSHVSSNFTDWKKIPIGALVYDDCNVGVYVGDGKIITCTNKASQANAKYWTEGVQDCYLESAKTDLINSLSDAGFTSTNESAQLSSAQAITKLDTNMRPVKEWTYWGIMPWIDYVGFNFNSVDWDSAPTNSSQKTSSKNTGGALKESEIAAKTDTEYVTVTYNKHTLNSVDTTKVNLSYTKATSLLTYPTFVESPFIIVKIGDYTFGSYSNYSLGGSRLVQYPNFVNDLSIKKVSNAVNEYTISLIYQIEAGQDPNFIDKILSSIGYGKIKLSYGDWMAPHFIYEEEEALITSVKSTANFKSSVISYTISATSTAVQLSGNAKNFPAFNHTKPSNIIIEKLLKDDTYGLLDTFKGMTTPGAISKLIPTDDKEVDIPEKESIEPLSYLNFLVSYMSSETNPDDSILRDSSYYLTIHDDTSNEYNGPYFKITKVNCKENELTLSTQGVYTVDVGYVDTQESANPLVENFQITNDSSWALLYNYSGEISSQEYVYSYDNNGNLITEFSPNYTTSSKRFGTTEAQRNWWTQMTQFPVTATLTIKGLLRPVLLMSYIKINAYFYGKRHISSGMYVITEQNDKVSTQGYRTTLTLQRVQGDNDYYTVQTVSEKRKLVTYTYTGTAGSDIYIGAWGSSNQTGISGIKTSDYGDTITYGFIPSKSGLWNSISSLLIGGGDNGITTVETPGYIEKGAIYFRPSEISSNAMGLISLGTHYTLSERIYVSGYDYVVTSTYTYSPEAGVPIQKKTGMWAVSCSCTPWNPGEQEVIFLNNINNFHRVE